MSFKININKFTKYSLLFFLAISLLFSYAKISSAINQTDEITISQNAYFEADSTIKDMQRKGYPTLPLIDLLSKSLEEFNSARYAESLNTSNEIKEKSIEIESLYNSLETLSSSIKLLNQFGVDTTSQELTLLYSKSDFESANIEISKEEAEKLESEIFTILSNISKKKYREIETYRENMLLNNVNETFFENYYQNQKDWFEKRNYSTFLSEVTKFEDLKTIIEKKQELEENIAKLQDQNISFERSKASLELFSMQINESRYSEAKNTITEINNLSKTALFLKNEFIALKEEYNRINSLGLLDNKTKEEYSKIQQEYSLENFKESEQLLMQTKLTISEIDKNNILFGGIRKAELKKSLKDFLLNNWHYLIVIIIMAILLFNPAKNYSLLVYSRKKNSKLKIEKEVILDMQKDLQKSYYIDHAFDKKSYHKEFQRYEERKIKLQNEIGVNEDKIKVLNEYFKRLKNHTN